MSYLEAADSYLNIGGKYGPARYHINTRYSICRPRVQLGKGSPEEIAEMAQRGHLDGVGIDCSGLICHIINAEVPIKKVLRYPFSKSIIGWLGFQFRPIEHANVALLTHPLNAVAACCVSSLKPLDIINFAVQHAMIILSVQGDTVTHINASSRLGRVVKGKIVIENPDLPLERQYWSDDTVREAYACSNRGRPGMHSLHRLKEVSLADSLVFAEV